MTPYDQEIQELRERVRTGIGRSGYEDWLLVRLIPEREGYLAAMAAYADLLAAAEATISRITDDHDCLDCGSQIPDGFGGVDHDQDCIVRVLSVAIAKAEGENELL